MVFCAGTKTCAASVEAIAVFHSLLDLERGGKRVLKIVMAVTRHAAIRDVVIGRINKQVGLQYSSIPSITAL